MVLDDNEKSITLTMADGATLKSEDASGLLASLAALNALRPISTVIFASPVLTITMKDTDTFTVTVSQAGFRPNGTGFWTEAQFTLLRSLGENVLALVRNNGVTAVGITYA